MFPYLEISDNIKIPMYNLMLGIGLILAILVFEHQINKEKVIEKSEIRLRILLIFLLVFGFIGAYVFDAITQGRPIFKWGGGISILGGFVSGICIAFLYSLLFKKSFIDLANFLVPSFSIAHAVGRIGCFFGGCCYGCETTSVCGVKFSNDSPAFAEHVGNMVARHPTQLYEALVPILFSFFYKSISREIRFATYLLLISVSRFCIEFLRCDDRGTLFSINFLTPSQLLSVLLFSISGLLLILSKNKSNNNEILI